MSIRLEGLRVAFPTPRGETRVVLDIGELDIEDGTQLCVTGHSGSGKSTLLNCMAGIVVPEKGRVLYDDLDIAGLGEHARDRFRAEKVGYVFQTFNLLRALTCVENVALAGSLAGMRVSEARDEAASLLDRVGLGSLADERIGVLSVGEQQRVAIARALINEPAVVLADEPTANLDEGSSDTVLELLIEIAAERDSILVLVTHEARVRERFDLVVPVSELGG